MSKMSMPGSYRSLFAAAFWLAAGLASHVSAQDPRPAERSNFTFFEFEPDNVLGDTVQPNGARLMARTRGARESLVQARLHFVRELCHSIEAL